MAGIPIFFGYNFFFWLIMSIARFITEKIPAFWMKKFSKAGLSQKSTHDITPDQVAVIMAAHNEELNIRATIRNLKKNVSAAQIYIGSDASTDQTVAIARQEGCHVLDLQPNRGKPRVLSHLLKNFKILERYKAVLIIDAEILVTDTYLKKALPYFDDPKVVVFVSHAISRWKQHWWPKWSMFFTAYRIRLWLTLYYGLRYGQTWKHFSVTPIVPGGSSIYRSSALSHIEIDTPGLVIEDFHMTFQVHHKKLGRIASHPAVSIIDQEPYTLRDYTRQVRRWFLGFWQTFFLHGYWPSFFWFATFFFTLEMVLSSIFLLTLPFILPYLLLTGQAALPLGWSPVPITVNGIILALFIFDYAVTMAAAWIEGKPALFLYGLGFIFLRYIDTIVFLWTMVEALMVTTATGQWKSPTRRA